MPPVNSKHEWPYPEARRFPTGIERFSYRTYNWFENRLWPIRPLPFLTATTAATAFQVRDLGWGEIKEDVQKLIKPLAISVGSIYTTVFLLRHFLKYFYFSYKGYLFESPKKPSIKSMMWAALRKVLLAVAPPQLSSCDSLLPNLPLPALTDTVDRYMESMKNFMSEDDYGKLLEMSRQFVANEGRSIQRYAWLLHKFSENYVTSLWETYIYNAGRYPLLINSSVAQCTMYGPSDLVQAYQVARLIYIETIANLALDRQKYLAVGDGLMSTRHYKNIYNGCRIPGAQYDHFKWNEPAKHVIVVHNCTWYKLDVCDANGRLYSVDELAKIIAEMMERDDKSTGFIRKVASLTTDGRTEWSVNRQKFFIDNKHNRQLLELIETAQFVMSVDGDLNWGVESTAQLSKYMKDMLAGDGSNRWVDKTMNYAVDASGRAGATGEHSPCDGAELDHLCENVLNVDKQILVSPTKEQQLEIMKMSDEERKTLKLAKKLDFHEVEGMESEINRCFEQHQNASDDLHMHSLAFTDFGKGRVKKCGISPDGFLQMAIQLANYYDQGKFVLTYEPGSVRFYANSRTETLRPVTDASCKFVRAMLNEESTQEERRELLKEACNIHVENCKQVMTGKGVDRHLFVLCVLAKGLGYNSPFLENYANQKWLLSTSNIPNMTNSVDEDTSENNIMLGASFGAVAENGYGICYRFAGNRAIMVHITSYHSAPNTDSDRFGQHLKDAFHALADLFEAEPINNNVTKRV
ncbi:CBN-CPT-4 protein [Caenorhabditis brenneri]|uniref:CBN-CPT-4 protein n=1 Tax=Caenorhabditis brenneri TaxID=135651 RepID=G0MS84_CAEBE|nr:CBN-CPT-4 protein [Caenorhabditis brenneri]